MRVRALFVAVSLTFSVCAALAQRQNGGEAQNQQYLDGAYLPIEQYLILLTYPEVQNELKMDLKQKVTLRDWVYAPFTPRINRAARAQNFTQQNMEFFNQMQIRAHLASSAVLARGYDSTNVWLHMNQIRQSQDRANNTREMNEAMESGPSLSPEEVASHLRAVAQRIPELLTQKQLQRLSEIYFQVNGPLVLTDRRVARMIPLSQEHIARAEDIGKLLTKRLNELDRIYPELRDNAPKAVFGGREDLVARGLREAELANRRLQAMQKEKTMAEDAIVQLLSQPEQERWTMLLGKLFKVAQGSRGIAGELKP